MAAASVTSSPNPAPPVSSWIHPVRLPEVAIPAARVYVPGSAPAVVHSIGWARKRSRAWTKNIVEPYISIRSPGRRTPPLNASAQASTVPAATGVPTGSPVSRAASGVTVPTISPGQASRGSGTPVATCSAQSGDQALRLMSYSGSHWLAV